MPCQNTAPDSGCPVPEGRGGGDGGGREGEGVREGVRERGREGEGYK